MHNIKSLIPRGKKRLEETQRQHLLPQHQSHNSDQISISVRNSKYLHKLALNILHRELKTSANFIRIFMVNIKTIFLFKC